MDTTITLLILVSSAYFTTARLQDAPDFVITGNPRSTPIGTEALVSAPSFSCEGRVSRWRVCLANDPTVVNYRINFQVWRQRDLYTLVGSNVLSSTATDIGIHAEIFDTYCVRFDVPQEQQISVMPEDYVGFHIEIIGQPSASTGGVLLSGNEIGIILVNQGPEVLTPGEEFPFVGVDFLFAAPLLDAVVDTTSEGSEGDTAPISISVAPMHTVYHTSSHKMSPSEYTQSFSTKYHHSSAHILKNTMTLSATIPDPQWLYLSVSTHIVNTSTSVTNKGVNGSTPNGNDLESAAKYTLVVVGVVIAIVSITVANATVILVCKYRHEKQATEGKVIEVRAASEFIYNSSYDSLHGHAKIRTNPRSNSAGHRSHSSLTHSDTDSTHYSYPSVEVGASYLYKNGYNSQSHDRSGANGTTGSSEDQTTKIGETSEVCLRKAVTQFQGIGCLQRTKQTAFTKETRGDSTNIQQLCSHGGDCDEGNTYDKLAIKKEEKEEGEENGGEVVSVYYSTPTKQTEPSSIVLSQNEAYNSRNSTSILLFENEAYNAKSPTFILVSENKAHVSGNAGGVSAENVSWENTESV